MDDNPDALEGATPVYGTRALKPRKNRPTRAELARLDAQLIEKAAADHPLSVRHLFYAMTAGVDAPVPKTEQGYRRVQRRVLALRKAGRIPYWHIADATRWGFHTPAFGDVEDYIRASDTGYRFDLWADSPEEVELWCESASIASVLLPVAERYGVSLYPCRGYPSDTFCFEAASGWRRPAHVYYVGDYDHDGLAIGRTALEKLREHTDQPVAFERLAVNEAQIAAHGLPTKPAKRPGAVSETVEAETMPAPVLRSLVQAAIEGHLPAGRLAYAQEMDEAGRHFLRTFDMMRYEEVA